MIKYVILLLFSIIYIAGSPRYTKISDVESALKSTNNLLVSNGKIGIDISHHNSIDWLRMYEKRERINFIYLRSTYGTVKDTKLDFNMKSIKRYNIQTGTSIGAYHFYRWSQSVPNQAKAFMTQWNKYKNVLTLAPVIDIENEPPINDNLFLPERENTERKELVTFVKEIARLTKKTPVLYTNFDYYERWIDPVKELHQYPLWLASYKDIDEIIENSKTGKYKHIKNPIVMVQYSKTGKIESCKGDIDLSIAFSSLNKQLPP
jgi:GH25 family lysozyme M1 (1,4-beta-N-acetylmuramidase)